MSGSAVGIIHAGKRVDSTNPLSVTLSSGAVTASDPGFLLYRNTALSNTVITIKASAAALFGIKLVNPNTTPAYVKLFNAASGSVTLGTTAPQEVLAVPAGDGTTPGQYVITPESIAYAYFSTALSIVAVTTLADSGTTAMGTAINVEAKYA